jgi:hypothetical protein
MFTTPDLFWISFVVFGSGVIVGFYAGASAACTWFRKVE